jgi:hypothetical protein
MGSLAATLAHVPLRLRGFLVALNDLDIASRSLVIPADEILLVHYQ